MTTFLKGVVLFGLRVSAYAAEVVTGCNTRWDQDAADRLHTRWFGL